MRSLALSEVAPGCPLPGCVRDVVFRITAWLLLDFSAFVGRLIDS
jgi:hypothetical protein